MSNKKSGNQFEATLCEILAEEGFWCHNLAQNSAGQPADVIAVKNGEAYLIDCKVCSRGRFSFDRIEEIISCLDIYKNTLRRSISIVENIINLFKYIKSSTKIGWFTLNTLHSLS